MRTITTYIIEKLKINKDSVDNGNSKDKNSIIYNTFIKVFGKSRISHLNVKDNVDGDLEYYMKVYIVNNARNIKKFDEVTDILTDKLSDFDYISLDYFDDTTPFYFEVQIFFK
mgnify:CR=1 FL=1